MYTIIDIETTGNGIEGNKITEISIFKYDGYDVIDEFTTLVNPEAEIPYFITGLTGIDNNMVRNAPKFAEVADKILEITKETIFVAHNVNFDYNIIKHEFKSIGVDFIRKKLCTVRLSRKLIPGYNSYSLGKLCAALEIPLTDRHRARGDAEATTILFEKLLRAEDADEVFKSFLNARSQEATLPPGLPKSDFDKLPNEPGIYFFKNAKGKIIYVGKAIDIKKRVLSHFYDKSTKEITLCQNTSALDFELSGSELLALLMESDAIKQHYPEYNRAQKKKIQPFGIFTYEDRNGVMHLAWNTLKMAPNAFHILYSKTDCRSFLQELCKTYKLCPKFCHLQENVTACSHYDILECEGICRDTEPIEAYNTKVKTAINDIQSKNVNFIIREKGRTLDESGVILIQDNTYMGYGFVENEIAIENIDDLTPFITPQKNTFETERLIANYVIKNEGNIYSVATK
ncbi:exonuclease domain-containing protein [Cellulophaga baltica]|uniref:DNA polymerase III subunit epsilon n=1 Tax=Cellulophaga baltica 18 TaxID=1348584 RepID=A0AAU8R6W2_9FLAO|nr:exonuclease domain-containing protein [Cellulophaga baltica]AIZ40220.1 DNA polymerase III subunit epsilon [Cellulophaga baltica 18]